MVFISLLSLILFTTFLNKIPTSISAELGVKQIHIIIKRLAPFPRNMKVIILPLIILFSCFSIDSNSQTTNRETWYMPLSGDNNYSLYVTEFGQGEPVIVLHGGFGAEHSYLIDLVTPLESEYRFILFDQRGSLRSPAPDSLLTFDGLIQDIENIRKELKIEKVRILGHSMGTRLAMAYAERYPNNVKSLTLVGAVLPKMQIPEGIKSPEQLPPPKFVIAQQYLTKRPEIDKYLEKYNLIDDSKLGAKELSLKWRIQFASANLYDISKFEKLQVGGAFYNNQTAQLISQSAGEIYNYIPSLKINSIPLAVINGDHDFTDFTALSYGELFKIMNPSLSQVPEEWMPDWTLYKKELTQLIHFIIPKAGHAPWIDNERETMDALKKALTRQ